MTISGPFIREFAERLQDVSLPDERASELAIEVARLNEAVRLAKLPLDFDAEPAAFFAALRKETP